MSQPIRIQRKRTKGFNLQAQSPDGRPVVSVCRPGKWGNPWKVDFCLGYMPEGTTPAQAAAEAVNQFRIQVPFAVMARPDYLTVLRGKHLACFCALDAPCHADVLLELANA